MSSPISSSALDLISCICNFTFDDGFSIQCEQCGSWQHVICMELNKDSLPEEYYCHLCEPRDINIQKAREFQESRLKRKRKQKAVFDVSLYNIYASTKGDLDPYLKKLAPFQAGTFVAPKQDVCGRDYQHASFTSLPSQLSQILCMNLGSHPQTYPNISRSLLFDRSLWSSIKNNGVLANVDIPSDQPFAEIKGKLNLSTSIENSKFNFALLDGLFLDCTTYSNEWRCITYKENGNATLQLCRGDNEWHCVLFSKCDIKECDEIFLDKISVEVLSLDDLQSRFKGRRVSIVAKNPVVIKKEEPKAEKLPDPVKEPEPEIKVEPKKKVLNLADFMKKKGLN